MRPLTVPSVASLPQVNVISRKDIENVIERHVLPCMGVSLLMANAPPGAKAMDVGTGGGFPGEPSHTNHTHNMQARRRMCAATPR
jgi:hypothetical protein